MEVSRRRNEGLARVFHDLGLMEREDSSFDLMYDLLLSHGVDDFSLGYRPRRGMKYLFIYFNSISDFYFHRTNPFVDLTERINLPLVRGSVTHNLCFVDKISYTSWSKAIGRIEFFCNVFISI